MKRAAAALRAKYERMRELRAAAIGEGEEAKVALRAFAAEWPGALKELDTLRTDEIERRARACAEGDAEPWMAWSLRYHELMRAALAIRRGDLAAVDRGSEDEDADLGASADGGADATAAAARAPVDAAFVAAVKRPRHGRLNVVVFAQLGREFGVAPREIWDVLFPPRGHAPRPYRR